MLRKGGLIIYPTDSSYALGCGIGEKAAMERICRIRRIESNHHFSLVCRDLSEISQYAKVNNQHYRLLKNLTPGPYTFICTATKQVPKRLMNPKRKTVGLRVPDNRIAQAIVQAFGEPLMSSTLMLPGDEFPLTDPYEMKETLSHAVDFIIDGGYCGMDQTTVIDLEHDTVEILRQGKGAAEFLEENA